VRNLLSLAIGVLALSCALWAGDLRRIAMVDLPGEPGFDSIAMANGNLVIAHSAANTVDIFNMPRRRLIAQIKNIPGASGVAVDAQGGRVYLSSKTSPGIYVVAMHDWSVENTIPTDAPVDTMLFSASAGKLFLSSEVAQIITAVDVAHGNFQQKLNVQGLPQGMAFDPEQKLLFVALGDQAQVIGIDPAMQIVKRFALHGSQPTGVAFDVAEHSLFVAVRSAVVELNAATGAEMGRVTAEPGVDSLWLDGSSRTLYAESGHKVQVIRVAGGRLADATESSIDVRGEGLAFDPSTNLVYVPGGREGKSKLLILKQLGTRNQSLAQENESGPQVATR